MTFFFLCSMFFFVFFIKYYEKRFFIYSFVKEIEGGILYEKRGVMFVFEAFFDDNY